MEIAVQSLSYAYGAQPVLKDVSFHLSTGKIVGLLGPNGAGKSTLIRLLVGYLPAPMGCITYSRQGKRLDLSAQRRRLGYLPEHNPLYEEMYVQELLQFYGKLYGLRKSTCRERIKDVLHACGLEAVKTKKVHTLSKGYQQRLGLARTLLHAPEVLILDEPTSGLDPNQLVEVRQLMHDLRPTTCVLLSTHILQEVEAVCDEVMLLHEGQLLVQQPLHTFIEQYKQTEVHAGAKSSLTDIFQQLTQSKHH